MAMDTTAPSSRPARAVRPLCAYSPRWLSGPTPAYEGLVATWSSLDDDRDVPDR